ncbi:MAG: hypothetical protein ABI670_00030 [Chloroflexota bacterium]
MPPRHRTNRNDLFLVRFWLEDMSSESEGPHRWGGRIQRAVSGESHEFNDWDALVNAFRTMLAATSPSLMVDEPPETQSNPTSESARRGEQQ